MPIGSGTEAKEGKRRGGGVYWWKKGLGSNRVLAHATPTLLSNSHQGAAFEEGQERLFAMKPVVKGYCEKSL